MKVEIVKSVCKEAEKLPKPYRNMVDEQIEILENAKTLYDVSNIFKIQGTNEPYYRLKFGAYRLMMYYNEKTNCLKILSLTHRKDTYKKQNLPWR